MVWSLIDREVIYELENHCPKYYLHEEGLPKVIEKREWVLLDLAAAISLITIVWLAYMFLPFLPFFG